MYQSHNDRYTDIWQERFMPSMMYRLMSVVDGRISAASRRLTPASIMEDSPSPQS